MTVFIVHPVKDDTSSALVYGSIEPVNFKYIYADELDGEKIPASFHEKMLKVADNFDPDNDYLLIAGDHLQIVALAAELSARWGRFRVLRFDRKAQGYLPVLIDTLEGFENVS